MAHDLFALFVSIGSIDSVATRSIAAFSNSPELSSFDIDSELSVALKTGDIQARVVKVSVPHFPELFCAILPSVSKIPNGNQTHISYVSLFVDDNGNYVLNYEHEELVQSIRTGLTYRYYFVSTEDEVTSRWPTKIKLMGAPLISLSNDLVV